MRLLGSGRPRGYLRVLNPSKATAKITQRSDAMGSLVASGQRIRQAEADQMRRLISAWQARSFSYYDQIGEIKYAAQFYSRMLSPLRLYVAKKDENGDLVEVDPAQEPEVVKLLDRVQDPGGGRTGLLSAYGRLMFLAGECYLYVSTDPHTKLEQWEMLSTDELRPTGSGFIRYRAPSLQAEEKRPAADDDWGEDLGEQAVVAYRIWQRHPRFSWLADATMMGVLDIAEELLLLTLAVRARARSRLAGNGILLVPEGIGPAPVENTVGDEDLLEDPFFKDLIEHIISPINNEGSASAAAPLIVRGPAESLKEMRHLQLVDPMQLYPETGLRRECVDRLAIGLDMPPEILTGTGDANHWCVDTETEILTADGWKRYGEFGAGDEVLTLNHDTGLSEWQPVEDVASFEVEDLPMLSIETRYHSSLTTLNHRWPILRRAGAESRWERGWAHSDELRTTHRLVTAAPSRDALWPQWVQHDDALVELVAWLWTEGEIGVRPGRRSPKVVIHQSHTANPDNVLRIRAALTSLYGAAVTAPMRGGRGSAIEQSPRWREMPRGGKTAFVLNAAAAERLLNHVDTDRVVSLDFIRTLTAAQLALFIETSTRADGSTMPSGCKIVGQKERARLAPLELAVILSGRSPSSYSQIHDGFARHEQHYVSVSERQTVRLKKIHLREERYTGTIWCPVTPNSTWCARRNGRVFFTGNSGWQIDESAWKAHGQPKAQQFCDDITGAYFRPALIANKTVTNWADYQIMYDPTAVINHPDRGKDAKDAHDRGSLSDAALREATGFTEDDAPNEEERNVWIGVRIRDGSYAKYGVPSKLGTGGIEPAAGHIEGAPAGSTTVDSGIAASEAPKGPPPAGPPDQPPEVAGPVVAASANGNGRTLEAEVGAARLLGACDLALYRARELAGNRLRSYANRDPELRAIVDAVRPHQAAFALGPERVRSLGVADDARLVEGAGDLIGEAIRLFGITDGNIADLIADKLEQHAARTLYEERPSPLPPSLQNYVLGLVPAS